MAAKKKGSIYIGTSNIVIPGNKQSFPEAYRNKSRLHYYASIFNSVEINSSFYKVPQPATFEKWAEDVPVDFKFAIKLWRNITHVKNLDYNKEDIRHFLSAAAMAGKNLGPLLLQFPGSITFDYYNKVAAIIEAVRQDKNNWQIAVEFRHPGWYVGETMELLDEFNASLVLHDMPKSKNREINKNAPFVFTRFHGVAGDYRGSYSEQSLKEYSIHIKKWAAAGKDVYAFFNNTIGAAFDNALQLRKLL